MALGTGKRQSQPDRAGRIHAVPDRLVAELLGVGATFLIDQRIAVEPGRDPLIGGRMGQQIRLPLAVLGAGQGLVHHPFKRTRLVIADARCDLLRFRRQAQQVQEHTSDQGATIGFGGR